MRRLIIFAFLISNIAQAQNTIQRPKIVVGIVVDQMRWDYLYRYYNRYSENGFKRLINQGFSCDNTSIPYIPAITACGHTSIYTGSVPAINGITGNDWWDYSLSQVVYCTGDDSTKTVGSNTEAGKMSPHNLLVTTICDELRLATNFRNKVVGIALKDRAAILPAGHSANAAFWYDDKTGDWITSSYYMNDLPKWVKDLNAQKLVDKYFAQDWNTLYPLNTYVQSTPDEEAYEYRPFGANAKGFPYNLKQFIGKGYGLLPVTPYGSSLTFDMAKAAINGEQLGSDSTTDFLAISLSTPDYIGHSFGPNSVEAEDGFLRLDNDLDDFLKFLDTKIGKGEYLVFLSADHGAAHVPSFLKDNKIPAGSVDEQRLTDDINKLLKDKFRVEKLVIGIINYQVFLDRNAIEKAKLNKELVNKETINFLMQQQGILRCFALDALSSTTLSPKIKNAAANGYFPSRSGDIQLIYQPQWIADFINRGTTHGAWNPYDTHIPLLWFGWNIHSGKTNREIFMTDIAPTIASMLHIQMPSGSIGTVIEELGK
ncbi:MAG TPA: alkaline phosphatase PafA [Puia sp.]|nr:alkaline phosphatase PafA [Puia sp.]